jgi:hypothetical protein
LWRSGELFVGKKIVKAGILDSQEELALRVPSVELYEQQRLDWVKEVDGAEQKNSMGA